MSSKGFNQKNMRTGIIGILVFVCVVLGYFAVGLIDEVEASNQQPGANAVTSENASFASTNEATFEKATVVRVVDGDTLLIDRGQGHERLRLVGMNAPESVAEDESRNCEEGRRASDYMKTLVQEGTPLWLVKDVSDTDQYGRLLRYVWLEEPDDARDKQEVATKMLNGILVADGYAEARRYHPDTAYAEIFTALGKEAIRDGRGVSYYWS